MGETIDDLARRASDAPALRCGARVLSYRDLERVVACACGELVARGVAPGDRVLVAVPNSIEYVVAVLAIARARAIAVPVPLATGAERLAHVIAATEPRLAIASVQLPDVPTWAIELDTGPAVLAPPPADPDAPAMLLFSSGSTGIPKGVVLTHRQLLTIADYLCASYGIAADHRELVIAPMCHSDGWQRTAATLRAGGCVCIGAGMLSIQGVLDDLRALEISGFFMPPSLVRYLLRSDARDALRACRTIEVGSAPFAPDELRALAALAPGARVFVHYGLTECSRAVILDVRAHPDKLATVGTPGPGVELRLDGGEILLRAPQLCTGYWRRPELDAERFRDGWLATGDHGALDADGFVTLAGRRDDMITCAGHHFFPADLELEIGPVAGVVQYLCAGVPDAVLGQVPWAFVVADGPSASHAFLARARRVLPPHLVPRRVVVIPSVPTLPSGKPDRRRTVELYT